MKELLNEKNESVTDTEGILDIQYDCYKNLYSCVEIEHDKIVELLDSIDVIINDNDCELCNSDISHEEIIKAIIIKCLKIKVQVQMDLLLNFIDNFIMI